MTLSIITFSRMTLIKINSDTQNNGSVVMLSVICAECQLFCVSHISPYAWCCYADCHSWWVSVILSVTYKPLCLMSLWRVLCGLSQRKLKKYFEMYFQFCTFLTISQRFLIGKTMQSTCLTVLKGWHRNITNDTNLFATLRREKLDCLRLSNNFALV